MRNYISYKSNRSKVQKLRIPNKLYIRHVNAIISTSLHSAKPLVANTYNGVNKSIVGIITSLQAYANRARWDRLLSVLLKLGFNPIDSKGFHSQYDKDSKIMKLRVQTRRSHKQARSHISLWKVLKLQNLV